MFFYLGDNCELLNKRSNRLFTDLGWQNFDETYFKGYCLEYDLKENIDKILGGDKPQGIYCIIHDNKLFYPEVCPFPLYQQGDTVTNLRLENFSEIENNKYQLPTTVKTLNEVADNIIHIIIENLSKFELNIWCTGGIDSTMLIALAEYANLPYTLHIAKPRTSFSDIKQWEGTVEEYNSPLLQFCRKNYWAYGFLSNFNDKVITTGFYGDEYFCRSIWQVRALASGFGMTPKELVKADDYVYRHINKPNFSHLQEIDKSITLENVKFSTIRMLGTSHVWHLDKTITFCPLMDKRIVENVWSLNEKTLLESCADATIQKEIINRTVPEVLTLTDDFKNAGLGRKNFFDNIEKVKLSHCMEIKTH